MATPPYELSPIVPDSGHATLPVSPVSSEHSNDGSSTEREHDPESSAVETSNVQQVATAQTNQRRNLEGFDRSPSPSLHNEELPAYSARSREPTKGRMLGENGWACLLAFVFVSLVLTQWIVSLL